MNLSIKKSITTVLSIAIFVKILGLFYKFFVARFLGFDGMTVFSLLSPILSLSLTLSSLSIPVVVNQNVSINISKPYYTNRSLILNAIKITLISSTVISIALLFLSKFISNNIYNNPYLLYPIYLIIPIIFFSNISGILKGYLDAHNYFRITQFSNLIEQITKVFLCLVCITLMHKQSINILVITIVIILGICEVASFSYLIIKIKKITPLNIPKEKLYAKAILSQAIPLTLNHLVCSLVSFLEPIILYKLVGYDIGIKYYTLVVGYASTLLTWSSFVNYGINKAIFPKLCAADKKKELSIILNKALYLSLFCGILNLNISYFHSNTALNLMFKNTDAALIVRELSIFCFLTFVNPIFVCTMQAKNLEKELLINTVITHIVELAILCILCKIYGVNGYKYTIIISSLLSFSLNYIVIRKKLDFKFNIFKLFSVFILIIINFTLSKNIKNEFLSFVVSNGICELLLLFYFRFNNLRNEYTSSITRSVNNIT
ncbi:MAG: oligosaccharide flippase family protein [Anaeroplasmataceae bacterium]